PDAGRRFGAAVRPRVAGPPDAAARASRARAHLSDPDAVSEGDALPQRGAGAARPRSDALERLDVVVGSAASLRPGARSARAGGLGRKRGPHGRGNLVRRATASRNGDGARTETAGAPARRAARRTEPGRTPAGARPARTRT